MSKYKYLVITDLDSTLLNDSAEVTPFSLKYIHDLNKRDDVLFAFSTGRGWEEAYRVYKQLQLKGFVSLCNGAMYHDANRNLSIYHFMSHEICEYILKNDEFFKNIFFGVIFTDKYRLNISPRSDRMQLWEQIVLDGANVFSFKLQFLQEDEKTDNENINKKINFLKKIDEPPYVIVYNYRSHRTVDFEIHSSHTNKQKAVSFFSSYYGIKESNIITLGDQINDLPAALGNSYFVAVKNATEMLRCSANKVSEFSNNEDAVVKEVELFLNKCASI